MMHQIRPLLRLGRSGPRHFQRLLDTARSGPVPETTEVNGTGSQVLIVNTSGFDGKLLVFISCKSSRYSYTSARLENFDLFDLR